MEDLLPILIVIAISLIGAVGRKKRKAKPFENFDQKKEVGEKKDSAIFDWLEKLNIEDDDPYRDVIDEPEPIVEVIPDEVPVKEVPKKEEKYKSQYEHYTGFISQSKKEELVKKDRSFVTQPKTTSLSNEIGKEQVESVRKKKKFDLRQAVIYSVVLNRKY